MAKIRLENKPAADRAEKMSQIRLKESAEETGQKTCLLKE